MQGRIGIVGAGGIGGTCGAYLTRAGHDVTLIDQWPAHVEAMRRDGLTLAAVDETFTVPVTALHIGDVSGLAEPFDVVFLSVKSYDTIWSTHLVAPFLKPTGFVLPVMNALNDETVAQIVGYPRTVGCVATISAGVYEPGRVSRTDPVTSHAFDVGELSGQITPRVKAVVEALQVIGPSAATTNIWGARWAKLVWNSMGNALYGALGAGPEELNEQEIAQVQRIQVMAGCESVRVAFAKGIALEPIWGIPPEDFAGASCEADLDALVVRMRELARARRGPPESAGRVKVPARPSLLQDVLKGRRTEVDYLNGRIVAEGELLGVPTPINQAIADLLRDVESGTLPARPANLARLRHLIRT